MKQIKLSQGKIALVDDSDYDDLSKFKWYAHIGYAVRHMPTTLGRRCVIMHRVIMNAPYGLEVDHINGNKLDNRRANLRICTRAENQRNLGIIKTNTSGFKGVSWDKLRGKWRAVIHLQRRQIFLGYFDTCEQAATVYDAASIKYHGDFARKGAR